MPFHIRVAVLLLFALCGGCSKEDSASAQIKRTYDAYLTALVTLNAAEAEKHVSSGTIDYYGNLANIALRGEERVVRALPSIDKIVVLRLRHELSRDALASMTGAKVFRHAVSAGWTDMRQMAGTKIYTVEISNDRLAFGLVEKQGQPTDLRFKFVRESIWKVDLVYTFRMLGPMLQRQLEGLASAEGVGIDEVVVRWLEAEDGRPVTKNLWVTP